VRKLIIETFFFKCRIDNYHSNRSNQNGSPRRNNFSRDPTATPKAPKNVVPDVSLNGSGKQKTKKGKF